MIKPDKDLLESIYNKYNRIEYVHPDPLEFLYQYDFQADREIVGLIASSLAYGRVAQILKSVKTILDIMGKSPHEYLIKTGREELNRKLGSFKHRFTKADEIVSLLLGIKEILNEYSSLFNCFKSFYKRSDENVLGALSGFVNRLKKSCSSNPASLVPDPSRGSACKRLNLFLRWLIRKDDVDPGGWDTIPSSALIIPLDTHMHRFSLESGLTMRKGNDILTAIEITEGFRKFSPDDPVKYDFSITRYGIRSDMTWEDIRKDLSD